MDVAQVLADLAAESADADRLVADLPAAQWATPTPSPGWTITHQVAHLAWTDHVSRLAIVDPDGFTAALAAVLAEPETYVDRGTQEFLDEPGALLSRWRAGRQALAQAIPTIAAKQRIPWYGTTLTPVSMATARIMETWAHGLDIADALGITREPSARLRHIAHLGHRTLGWSFLAHDRSAPTVEVRLELSAPDGALWTFGPPEATDRVTGPALDFCLLVTQRRHRADLALVATPGVADEWLDVAQAFAGPPGAGRAPSTQPATPSPTS